jgi:hypothetical protein
LCSINKAVLAGGWVEPRLHQDVRERERERERDGRKKHTAARGDRTAVAAFIPDNDSNPNLVVAYLCLSVRTELRSLLTITEATTTDSKLKRKDCKFISWWE